MINEDVTIVGLTGPTGSGKSYVAGIFEKHGFKIIDADKLARDVVKDKEVLKEMQNAFGEDIVKNGMLDRKLVAKRAFSSRENELKINAITHPRVLKLTSDKVSQYVLSGEYKILFDAALLFESDADAMCTTVVSVIAPVEERINRIIKRDNITREEAIRRISVQQSDDYYKDRSEYVIINDSNLLELEKKTLEIIKEV